MTLVSIVGSIEVENAMVWEKGGRLVLTASVLGRRGCNVACLPRLHETNERTHPDSVSAHSLTRRYSTPVNVQSESCPSCDLMRTTFPVIADKISSCTESPMQFLCLERPSVIISLAAIEQEAVLQDTHPSSGCNLPHSPLTASK